MFGMMKRKKREIKTGHKQQQQHAGQEQQQQQQEEPLMIEQTDLPSAHNSSIFERSVLASPSSRTQSCSRTQSFSSCNAIPYLDQDAYVPSVLDATSRLTDSDSVELICGPSGHPLCQRRHTVASMCPLSHHRHVFTPNEDATMSEGEEVVDYSDQTKLNFCSFADLMSDEEVEARSPVLTRRNSIVVVPLSLRAAAE